MEDLMENLFYSEKEKFLFYIAKNTNISQNVEEIIKMLTTGANILAELISVERKAISTYFVTNSRRYKYMRVFYVKTDVVPEGASKTSDGLGMHEWVDWS